MAVDVAVELLLHPEHAIQVKQLEGSFSGDFDLTGVVNFLSVELIECVAHIHQVLILLLGGGRLEAAGHHIHRPAQLAQHLAAGQL